MSEGWNIDTLKEHLEKLILAKEDGIKAALLEREKALLIQAAEYERRLNGLNGEYERIEKIASSCVTYATLYSSFIALAAVVSIGVAVAAIYFR